jgi:hypothetical protein
VLRRLQRADHDTRGFRFQEVAASADVSPSLPDPFCIHYRQDQDCDTWGYLAEFVNGLPTRVSDANERADIHSVALILRYKNLRDA